MTVFGRWIICGWWLGCLLISSVAWADDKRFTVIHSNDIYGQLLRRGGFGGMAARVQMIRGISKTSPTVVVDAGDALGPNGVSNLDKGATMIAAMRYAHYAAMLPGNHDLSLGWDVLKQRGVEAKFPFLLANLSRKDRGPPPLPGHVVVQVGEISVGVLGVLGLGELERIDPKHTQGLILTDPIAAADQSAKILREEGAVCVIALVHMNEASALSFARKTKGIDLVVAGGFSNFDQVDRVPSLMQLQNGVAVVSTPGFGSYIGRVDVRLSKHSDGQLRVSDISTSQLVVDRSVEEDLETAQFIAGLKKRYDQKAKQPMGQVEATTLDTQGEIVAGLMRLHTNSEVGIVNRGALDKVPSGKPLKAGHVDQLIRFDNQLVKMVLTGLQLKTLVDQSEKATRAEARLIFSGLQAKKRTINGRPLINDETYRVVVSDFLANGGDGYATFPQGKDRVYTGITLQGLVVAALQDTQRVLRPSDFTAQGPQAVWRMKWGAEGAFNRNYIDGTTLAYRAEKENISFLSGETSVSWNAILQWVLTRDMGQQLVRFENRVSFGQVGTTFGDLEKSEDQFDADLTYVYRTRNFAVEPFASAGYSTALTATEGQRPKLVRSSTGFQRRVQRALLVRLGARAQRDLVLGENDVGIEIGLDAQAKFNQTGQVRSRVRSFFGVTDRRVISVENYNTLTFPLLGGVSMSARQSNFLYRVNKIRAVPVDGIAFRWDLTLSVGYDLDWKWY